MNIEQKLAYVRKALEMGADVEVKFHDIRTQDKAEKAAIELSELSGLSHRYNSHNETHWYRLRSKDYSLETTIFFDAKEEEVIA